MGTLIGIIIGVLSTIIVSNYYFKRAGRKRLTPYRILSSRIFAGIEPEVRQQLHFTFRNKEVKELRHLEFLIANDGERAISNFIEPLRLELTGGVEVLDASILHREPRSLQVHLRVEASESGAPSIVFDIPLLNKGDFFLVKLLLSGDVQGDDLAFRVLGEDLPRSLKLHWLPPSSLRERKVISEVGAVIAGSVVLAIAAADAYVLYLLHGQRPDLFPYPWATFQLSVSSVLVTIFGLLGALILALIGGVLAVGIGLEDLYSRGPRFPLPKQLRRGAFEFPFDYVRHQLEAADIETTGTKRQKP